MAWQAKPHGYYGINSNEGHDNIDQIWNQMQADNYTTEAAAGAMGNVYAESGLNPWRWQSDTVNLHAGYGLFQYTPASGYINLPGTTPNMSTTSVTPGASASDGARQVDCFLTNELGKWVSTAWRSYWDPTQYASLYAKRNQWLQQWGSGGHISMSEFAAITDLEAATFFFLACFEGPRVPSLGIRYSYAQTILDYLGGGGGGGGGGNIKAWLLLKAKRNQRHIMTGNLTK